MTTGGITAYFPASSCFSHFRKTSFRYCLSISAFLNEYFICLFRKCANAQYMNNIRNRRRTTAGDKILPTHRSIYLKGFLYFCCVNWVLGYGSISATTACWLRLLLRSCVAFSSGDYRFSSALAGWSTLGLLLTAVLPGLMIMPTSPGLDYV